MSSTLQDMDDHKRGKRRENEKSCLEPASIEKYTQMVDNLTRMQELFEQMARVNTKLREDLKEIKSLPSHQRGGYSVDVQSVRSESPFPQLKRSGTAMKVSDRKQRKQSNGELQSESTYKLACRSEMSDISIGVQGIDYGTIIPKIEIPDFEVPVELDGQKQITRLLYKETKSDEVIDVITISDNEDCGSAAEKTDKTFRGKTSEIVGDEDRLDGTSDSGVSSTQGDGSTEETTGNGGKKASKLRKPEHSCLKDNYELLLNQLPISNLQNTTSANIVDAALQYIQSLQQDEENLRYTVESLKLDKAVSERTLLIMKKGILEQFCRLSKRDSQRPKLNYGTDNVNPVSPVASMSGTGRTGRRHHKAKQSCSKTNAQGMKMELIPYKQERVPYKEEKHNEDAKTEVMCRINAQDSIHIWQTNKEKYVPDLKKDSSENYNKPCKSEVMSNSDSDFEESHFTQKKRHCASKASNIRPETNSHKAEIEDVRMPVVILRAGHIPPNPKQCNVCDRKFPTVLSCVFHTREHCTTLDGSISEVRSLPVEKITERQESKDEIHKCNVCGKEFSCLFLLSIHNKDHLKVELYDCKEMCTTMPTVGRSALNIQKKDVKFNVKMPPNCTKHKLRYDATKKDGSNMVVRNSSTVNSTKQSRKIPSNTCKSPRPSPQRTVTKQKTVGLSPKRNYSKPGTSTESSPKVQARKNRGTDNKNKLSKSSSFTSKQIETVHNQQKQVEVSKSRSELFRENTVKIQPNATIAKKSIKVVARDDGSRHENSSMKPGILCKMCDLYFTSNEEFMKHASFHLFL